MAENDKQNVEKKLHLYNIWYQYARGDGEKGQKEYMSS